MEIFLAILIGIYGVLFWVKFCRIQKDTAEAARLLQEIAHEARKQSRAAAAKPADLEMASEP